MIRITSLLVAALAFGCQTESQAPDLLASLDTMGSTPDGGLLVDNSLADQTSGLPADPKLVSHAESAAAWLDAQAERTTGTARWPEYVGMPAWTGKIARPVALYDGVAGIALFLGKLATVTKNPAHDKLAGEAAQQLSKSAVKSGDGVYWENEVELKDGSIITYDNEGLYNGAAGIGHVLLELGKDPRRKSLTDLALGAGNWILARAKQTPSGCSWTYGMTDIIGGNAGIILFLLELHKESGGAKYLDGAKCAGDWLLLQGVADGDSTYWHAQQGGTRIYPGFSHGVAGISYALAVLSEATGEAKYLDSAKSGARWLKKEVKCDSDGCRWYHYKPDNVDSYASATGWCHGVAGHGRFLMLMDRLTGNPSHRKLAEEAARWVMKVADTSLASPQFWGLSFCCGAASVGEFFVDLYRSTGKPAYKAYAHQVAAHLVAKGKQTPSGMAWTNYNAPDQDGRIWYGTGLKLGAAGAGWFLLRAALLDSGVKDQPGLLDERL